MSINDVTVGEGSGHALLTVSLTTCALAVSVQYATQNGTAVAGSDYAARAGTLTFARRETSKTIAVPIINDSSPEGHETFSVRLSSASKAAIADSTGAVTIQDDDVPGPCSPMPQCLL